MPGLDKALHVNMLERSKAAQPDGPGFYGLQWGDPNTHPALQLVRDRFLAPYVKLNEKAVEIGPGGGRWTRYMLSFQRLYVVDHFQELLDELARNFRAPHLTPIRNNGTDFPGIPDSSIDFVFSFGVFVHLDLPIIDGYLQEMRRILRPSANVVIQYSDKRKPEAARNASFADNDPDRMRQLVEQRGYVVVEEDLDPLPHSAIIRFRPE